MGKKGKGFNELENICEDREAARASAATGCMELERYEVRKICVEGFDHPDCAAEGAQLATYKYQEYKSKPQPTCEVTFYAGGACDAAAAEELWRRGCVGARGQNVARTFQERPANKLTPTLFAECVRELLCERPHCHVEVHEREWIEKKRMGAFLSVSAGSEEEPRFVEVTYANGAKGCKPIVLVGKGVTFDSGGISIKPSAQMDLMRGDMGGAATVVGAMDALTALCAKLNVKCLIPMTENMPSGRATRPGDVVTAMNGKTICVDNTDAEGRLILADALAYGACFEPKFIVDVATLTGAIGVALGKAAAGGYTNCRALFNVLEEAGARTGDRVWRMPLWNYYNKVMTDFAAYDVNNAAGKGEGGSCTAAAFLSEFVPKGTDWIHLDIAGTAVSQPQPQKYIRTNMSGRPTRTLIEFLMMNQQGHAAKLEKGSVRTFWGIGGAQSKFNVVTVVGLGDKSKGFNQLENICEDRECARVAAAVGCLELERFDVHKIAVEDFCNPDCAAEGANLALFKYQEYKSKPKPATELTFYPCGCCDAKAAELKWNRGLVMADGQNLARRLADRPANKCTPTLFANCVQALLANHPTVKVDVRDKKWLEEMKMGAFLAVNAGSHEEPKMIEVTYTNADPQCPPIVLIGKGVTFDAGGICIKPCEHMHLMRGGVAGGAVVAGAMHAVAYLGPKVNMKCLIPLTDNKPSGRATCPGDVVTAMNGKTIAMENTDAEGRLMLADALCYGVGFKPKMIVDVATLSRAVGVALGKGAAGVYSNSGKLLNVIEEAGARTGDRVWRMPLWNHFRAVLTNSDAYDLNNVAPKDGGGSCVGAAFLAEFVPKDTCWMHLDIAGVDDPPHPMRYLTSSMSGRPTRTLIEFVMMNETQ